MPPYFARKRAHVSVSVYNSASVTGLVLFFTCQIRFKNGDTQEIQQMWSPTLTNRLEDNITSTDEVQQDGEVISFQIGRLEGPGRKRGQTWIAASLVPRGVELAHDYLQDGRGITLGNFVDPGPGGGHGILVHTEPASPAAGADYSEVVPAGAIRLYRANALLFTSAVAAANRQFGWLFVRSGGGIGTAASHSEDFQVASSAVTYEGTLGVTDQAVVAIGGNIPTATRVTLPLPNVYLFGGDTFRTFIVLIQAADQISSVGIDYEEWIMP